MGVRRWTVEHMHDPDDGCKGCPAYWDDCGDPACDQIPGSKPATCELWDAWGASDLWGPAPDWCPLRALPDAEEVGHG